MTTDTATRELDPDELASLVETAEEVTILDVRNRDEVDAWQIEGPGIDRTHVPYMRFVSAQVSGDVSELVDPDRSYVVVCPHGEASAEVAEMLTEVGIDAKNLAGGMQGWAKVYTRRQLPDTDLFQYYRPASGCLAYAVVSAGEALVVDPLRAFADRYRDEIQDLDAEVTAVLDTHVHADHFSALPTLANSTGATAIVSEGAAERGLSFEVETVTEGETIQIGDHEFEILSTPGHTTGSISLLVDDVLLSGDSLFLDGTPRPDLQKDDADAPSMARTLHETVTERIAPLPDDTLVAPGHVPPGRQPSADGTYTDRLGTIRNRVRAFSEDREAFVERILDSMGDQPANFEQIIAVNLGQETVGDSDAFELELGPNNCAVSD
ncbi:MAG: MBL fold metallo-hydrolase [Halovenus sp.]|uniref:MBL fold metallo-hydrolase n=1 Tax=Halovenus amylolytica TaxID=2500550 RepID=UPI000FE2E41D